MLAPEAAACNRLPRPMTTTSRTSSEALARPGEVRLRSDVEALSAIHRPSASLGELEAAEWLLARLAEHGIAASIEDEDGHGTYWWPLGVASAAGALAGIAGLRGRRAVAAAIGAAATAAAIDDLHPRGRRLLRRLLRRRPMHNVVAEAGPGDADRTVVLVAHHDAAHSGLLYHPAIPEAIFGRFPAILERTDTSPGLMWPVLFGPAAV